MRRTAIRLLIALVAATCQTDREVDRPDDPVVGSEDDTGRLDGETGRADGDPVDTAVADDPVDARAERMAACPIAVEGTKLEVDRRDDAVVLAFTTPADAEDLRDRVHQLARRHNERRDRGRRGDRAEADELPHERMLMLRRATSTTEPAEDGLRLVLIPEDADDLEALYRHMTNMQSRIAGMHHRPDCPIFRMMELGKDRQ